MKNTCCEEELKKAMKIKCKQLKIEWKREKVKICKKENSFMMKRKKYLWQQNK